MESTTSDEFKKNEYRKASYSLIHSAEYHLFSAHRFCRPLSTFIQRTLGDQENEKEGKIETVSLNLGKRNEKKKNIKRARVYIHTYIHTDLHRSIQ